MTRWVPAKDDVLDALAREILGLYGRGRVVVAVDGVDRAAAERFGVELAAAIHATGHGAFAARLADFAHPLADQPGGSLDADERAFRHAYDYSQFRRVLYDPFKLGGSTGFVLSASAPTTKWTTGPHDTVLVVAGEFALRAELRGAWNYTIWLETATGEPNALYRAETNARAAATAIVDASDPEHPRRVFADAC